MRLLHALALVLVVVAACAAPPRPQAVNPEPSRGHDPRIPEPSPGHDPRMPALTAEIETLLAERDGTYGVSVGFVPTGQRATRDADRVFASASVYKIAVAYEVLRQADRGALGLADPLMVEDEDVVEAEPAGGLAPDEEVSVWAALEAMMGVSSNSAAHALMRLVGRGQINASLTALGLRQTRVPLDATESAVTTAADMAQLFDLLATDRLLAANSRAALRTLLALPEEVDPLVACLPPGTQVLSKVGNGERASNVSGLVETPRGPLIISVFDDDVDPGEARATIEAIALAAWSIYSE